MIRHITRALLVALICLWPGWLFSRGNSQTVVLVHATVIDVKAGKPRKDQTVIVNGNRIEFIGRGRRISMPVGARVLDGTGKFLIPGLWDMHAHWNVENYFSLFTANGVTGIRQMFGEPEMLKFRRQIESGKLIGPRMVIAGPIVDGPKPTWPTSIAVTNAADGLNAVSSIKKDGYDFVKVYNGIPREAYFAIAGECKRSGLVFAGHVPDAVSAREASRVGQKSIEHLDGVFTACSTLEEKMRQSGSHELTNEWHAGIESILDSYSPAKAKALFQQFRQNHTWQCPTLAILHNLGHLLDGSLTNDVRLNYMPMGREFARFWDPAGDARLKTQKAEDYLAFQKYYKKLEEAVKQMHRAGIGILCGTDCSNPYSFPGFSVHDELARLVEAGLTPMEALQTATLNPAIYFNQTKDLGTIEKGKLADLILLDADPLKDIHNTMKISVVVQNGRIFDRVALDEILTTAEKSGN